MRQSQRARLIDLLGIQSASGKTSRIRAYVHDQLIEAGMEVEKRDKQLFARKGNVDGPVPYLVAHSDTVHAIVDSANYAVGMYTDRGAIVYHAFDPATKNPRGVGGDDKCGLWVCVEAAYALENLGVVITIDEERGCLGARKIRPEQLADASVLIQADRRGSDDAVRETWSGKISGEDWQGEVARAIKTHGYDWCDFGAGTDVAVMGPAARVSAINLSAGYHDPHTARETVSEEGVENALELALALAEASGGKRWTYERPASSEKWTKWSGEGGRRGTVRRQRESAPLRHNAKWDESMGASLDTDTGDIGQLVEAGYVWLDKEAQTKLRTFLGSHTTAYDPNANRDDACAWVGCNGDGSREVRSNPFPDRSSPISWYCREHIVRRDTYTRFLGRQSEERRKARASNAIAIPYSV